MVTRGAIATVEVLALRRARRIPQTKADSGCPDAVALPTPLTPPSAIGDASLQLRQIRLDPPQHFQHLDVLLASFFLGRSGTQSVRAYTPNGVCWRALPHPVAFKGQHALTRDIDATCGRAVRPGFDPLRNRVDGLSALIGRLS